jgi:predicted enzyme related to lactoylglutathione lyase
MARLLLNLDVDDVERAIAFYTEALGLKLGRRFDEAFVELIGGEVPLYLLQKDAGSAPFDAAKTQRDYARHWTPLHLDFAVDDIDAALARVSAAGGSVESDVSEHVYGRLALCADPFGHGFCLLEFRGQGYGEIERSNPAT